MGRILVVIMVLLTLIGCASRRPSRKGVLSKELPLTLNDLAEIRSGELNHKTILTEYTLYNSPKLEAYANALAATIAEVSTRPHLPYRVVLLDTDEVNIFGGPGGFIYITRGLCNFVETESELAGVIAHEIGHISAYEYAHIPQMSKMKYVYDGLLKGSEFAKASIGTYGTAANTGLKGLGKAAPMIAKQFGHDQEITADENAVKYLVEAGYNPAAFQYLVERLSRIPMEDVGRFVLYMNTHPPFQSRRALLDDVLKKQAFDPAKIEVKKDLLGEVRQMSLNSTSSVLFEPALGVHEVLPLEIAQLQSQNDEKFSPDQKSRSAWI